MLLTDTAERKYGLFTVPRQNLHVKEGVHRPLLVIKYVTNAHEGKEGNVNFLATIYHNLVVPRGYYFVKVVDLRTQERGTERPLIWMKLEVGPDQGEASGKTFCTVIHPTTASHYRYINFIHAF